MCTSATSIAGSEPDDRAAEHAPVRERDRDALGTFDDVVVRQDDSRCCRR